jgi:hypothetical protein
MNYLKLIVITLALLWALPVQAASFFNIEFTLGAQTVDHASQTYSDANGQRFSDYIWASYPQLDVDGNPLPDTPANRAQAFRDWADAIYAGTKANVLRWEDQQLKEAVAPPPLDPE